MRGSAQSTFCQTFGTNRQSRLRYFRTYLKCNEDQLSADESVLELVLANVSKTILGTNPKHVHALFSNMPL